MCHRSARNIKIWISSLEEEDVRPGSCPAGFQREIAGQVGEASTGTEVHSQLQIVWLWNTQNGDGWVWV